MAAFGAEVSDHRTPESLADCEDLEYGAALANLVIDEHGVDPSQYLALTCAMQQNDEQGTKFPKDLQQVGPENKDILTKVLGKANAAVLLDHLQNFEGAMRVYSDRVRPYRILYSACAAATYKMRMETNRQWKRFETTT
ncbi:hypothetical protein BJ878DRAFT_479458 [Calycina marina]|uniref:Uncharacterized protein n=1 Tax=Calycina marina TaxID=1763456 RepID=A0A9P7Z422_9HELO|nr:hypothetical protein BJ878DRAFT_479458 [Calycina marina]